MERTNLVRHDACQHNGAVERRQEVGYHDNQVLLVPERMSDNRVSGLYHVVPVITESFQDRTGHGSRQASVENKI